MKRAASTFLSVLVCAVASAQFSITGTDPGHVKWSQATTENFRLIFPSGQDSLAKVYGTLLEAARLRLERSSGFFIGQSYRSRLPVVLHSFNATSNASVTWAPKRMDIFTVRDPYSPTPVPWEKHLAIHEGRHAAQMQFGAAGSYRIVHYVTGEMVAGALAGIFPGPTLLEGDAVVAETALTRSGRGRQASFMNYMMPAFDCGDWRDYYKWTYGSQRLYAPDYYRVGYMLVAGTRVFFNDPLFTQEYFARVVRRGGFFNVQATVKAASGKKFKQAFREIEESFHKVWAQDAARRGPFMESTRLTQEPRLHTDYGRLANMEGAGIFAIRSGLSTPVSLVRIGKDGAEERVRPFSAQTSSLFSDSASGKLYWSETVPGVRWSLESHSRIRYIDVSDPGKIHDLTREGKYFNPAPSPDGRLLSVTEYPASGGSRVCMLDASDGMVKEVFQFPDSLQFTETVWVGDRLFAAALSDGGMGIYELPSLRKLAGPQPVELSTLRLFPSFEDAGGPAISFVCDRSGVQEMYALNVDTGRLTQLTSTRYGIRSPVLNASADTLFYTSVASSGHPGTYRHGSMIYATAVRDLCLREVSFDDVCAHPVADALSAQEEELGAGETGRHAGTVFSQTRPYSKIRFPNLHSWAPVYFNYDNVDNLSWDHSYEVASIGATAFFQDLLGTGFGFVGYSFHEDPYQKEEWRHSGHLKYTCTGLWPVLEFSADFNDSHNYSVQRSLVKEGRNQYVTSVATLEKTPDIKASLTAYVPLNFSSGGWTRGIVPRVGVHAGNNRYVDDIKEESVTTDAEGNKRRETTGIIPVGNDAPVYRIKTSVRGYAFQGTPPSCIYPKFGFGAELGFQARPGHTHAVSPAAFAYVYSYFPGIGRTQGIRVSAAFQRQFHDSRWCFGENIISLAPRGFASSTLPDFLSFYLDGQFKMSVDYAIPIATRALESVLSPVAYIKRLEVVPFVDWTVGNMRQDAQGAFPFRFGGGLNFVSAGADLALRLSNFLWIPYASSLGVRLSYNAYDNFSIPEANGTGILDALGVKGLKPFTAQLIFGVDF